MNRRNLIKGTLGATAATLVPAAVATGPVSREDAKRDLLFRLIKLSRPEQHEIMILGIVTEHDHWCRDDTLALLDQGLPVSEVHRRISQKIDANCDAISNS